MDSMREIRAKIKAVRNIERVTRSMKMIAGVRLRQSEHKLVQGRPYAQSMRALLLKLAAGAGEQIKHPLFQVREIKKRCYIVVTSDRSLCGSYNINVVRFAEQVLPGPANTRLIALGKFGYRYFQHLGYDLSDCDRLTEMVDFAEAKQLGAELVRDFLNGTVDEVNLVYSRYQGLTEHAPALLRLLPVAPEDIQPNAVSADRGEYIFEPSPDGVFLFLLPKYINVILYSAILEAKTSEHASRMLAMDTATRNAVELVEELDLEYNRSRQEAITSEIVEIVGAAELSR